MPGRPKADSSWPGRVRSLSIVLQDVDINLSDYELNDRQRAHLGEICSSCREVLSDLEKTLAKYQALEDNSKGLGPKVKKIWKRLQWEPQDVCQLRDRITSNITLLQAFLGGISRYFLLSGI